MPTKTKKPKAFLVKPRAFTIPVDDADGNFDATHFVWGIAGALSHYNPVIVYERPLTVAELEKAEAFAHEQVTNRVESCDGVPPCLADELVENPDCGSVSADELASWAIDVECEARAWERIANELLAAREAAASTSNNVVPLKRKAA
jgi:hypothetical protein